MNVFKISQCFLISNDKDFESAMANAVKLSLNNPKLKINLMCLFNGKRSLSEMNLENTPTNLIFTRYPCNREFDKCHALVNYLLKQDQKYYVILNNTVHSKVSRYRIIYNRLFQKISTDNSTFGYIIKKEHLILRLQKNFRVLKTIENFI